MRRALLLLSVLLLAGLAPAAPAQGLVPPASASSVAVGGATFSHWTGTAEAADANVTLGGTGTLWVAMRLAGGNVSGAHRAYVNLTSDALAFATPALVLAADATAAQGWTATNATFTTNRTDAGAAPYAFTVEVYREDANGTVLLGTAAGEGRVALVRVPVEQPPVGIPAPYLVGGGAAVL